MINYNQVDITATQFSRAGGIIIENPYNGVPTLNFLEERITELPDGTVTICHIGRLPGTYDPTNPLHVTALEAMETIYVALATARDILNNALMPPNYYTSELTAQYITLQGAANVG